MFNDWFDGDWPEVGETKPTYWKAFWGVIINRITPDWIRDA